MYPFVGWGLQVLILTTGIYIFLRFLRTTRGGGLIRGLVVALLLGAVGSWGLAKLLGLNELEHIVQSITGFVVVIFAILFQPELRRGIAQLGEHPLLGRLLDKRRPETTSEVSQAIVRLAKKRRGAMVAFEREMPLDSYIENGVDIDAAARSILIESIFQPGGPLHDGAVVIRKDRVAAALCLFPLTENVEVAKSIGTRHRAALGLTEGTDAVTVAVSEETGDISVCTHGAMQRGVRPEQVESLLREALHSGVDEESEAIEERPDSPLTWVRDVFAVDAPRKLTALVLAVALFFLAHQEISSSQEHILRVVSSGPEVIARAVPGELMIQVPATDQRLVSPRPGEVLRLVVAGKREALDKLGRELGGVLKLDPAWKQQEGEAGSIAIRAVSWGPGPSPRELGLRVDWAGRAPQLAVEALGSTEIELLQEHLHLDLGRLAGELEADPAELVFEPQVVTVSGPQAAIDDLEAGRLAFALQNASVRMDGPGEWTDRLALHRDLLARGLALDGLGTVRAVLPVHAGRVALPSVKMAIALVCFDPAKAGELARLHIDPTAHTALVEVLSAGLLSGEPGGRVELALRRVIREELLVYVDVAEAIDGRAPVRLSWRRDWSLALAEELGSPRPGARLDVSLQSDATVPLIARDGRATIGRDDREQ